MDVRHPVMFSLRPHFNIVNVTHDSVNTSLPLTFHRIVPLPVRVLLSDTQNPHDDRGDDGGSTQ